MSIPRSAATFCMVGMRVPLTRDSNVSREFHTSTTRTWPASSKCVCTMKARGRVSQTRIWWVTWSSISSVMPSGIVCMITVIAGLPLAWWCRDAS
jgi:hypothetical protein